MEVKYVICHNMTVIELGYIVIKEFGGQSIFAALFNNHRYYKIFATSYHPMKLCILCLTILKIWYIENNEIRLTFKGILPLSSLNKRIA